MQLQEMRSKSESLSSCLPIESFGRKIVNWEKLRLIGRDRAQDSFKSLVDRKVREQRRHERRVAEHRTTKHQLQARSSCVADARSYRVARRLPVPAPAKFDWKALIPMERLNKVRSAWHKKFRDHQFTRWLTAK
jgi:hypothetical protein